MVRKKQIIFPLIIIMMCLVTACSKTKEEEVTDEQIESNSISTTIEAPIVTLENIEQGVLVKWNEIANAEGYYVYSKTEGESYNRIATITDPAVTEYLDSEASVKTRYNYTVIAYVGEHRSDYMTANITTGIWKPEYKVVYEEPVIKIIWEEIPGSNGYIVYRKETGENYAILATIEDSTITSYIDEAISPGGIYAYAVKAYVGEEQSSYTALLGVAIQQPYIEVNNIAEGIEIIWDEVEEAEGYYVYRKEDGGEYEIIQELDDAEITTYLDTSISVGKKYFYAVRAYLGEGEYKSDFTPVSITAGLGRVEVSLKTLKDGVQIVWNEIAVAEGYYIYRKEESEEEYSLVHTITDVSTTTYVDEQAEKGKTYYYCVRAFIGDEQSGYSGGTITIKK